MLAFAFAFALAFALAFAFAACSVGECCVAVTICVYSRLATDCQDMHGADTRMSLEMARAVLREEPEPEPELEL